MRYEQQERILRAARQFMIEHGDPPTMRELADAVGQASSSAPRPRLRPPHHQSLHRGPRPPPRVRTGPRPATPPHHPSPPGRRRAGDLPRVRPPLRPHRTRHLSRTHRTDQLNDGATPALPRHPDPPLPHNQGLPGWWVGHDPQNRPDHTADTPTSASPTASPDPYSSPAKPSCTASSSTDTTKLSPIRADGSPSGNNSATAAPDGPRPSLAPSSPPAPPTSRVQLDQAGATAPRASPAPANSPPSPFTTPRFKTSSNTPPSPASPTPTNSPPHRPRPLPWLGRPLPDHPTYRPRRTKPRTRKALARLGHRLRTSSPQRTCQPRPPGRSRRNRPHPHHRRCPRDPDLRMGRMPPDQLTPVDRTGTLEDAILTLLTGTRRDVRHQPRHGRTPRRRGHLPTSRTRSPHPGNTPHRMAPTQPAVHPLAQRRNHRPRPPDLTPRPHPANRRTHWLVVRPQTPCWRLRLRWLGHTSIKVTVDRYGHLAQDGRERCRRVVDETYAGILEGRVSSGRTAAAPRADLVLG